MKTPLFYYSVKRGSGQHFVVKKLIIVLLVLLFAAVLVSDEGLISVSALNGLSNDIKSDALSSFESEIQNVERGEVNREVVGSTESTDPQTLDSKAAQASGAVPKEVKPSKQKASKGIYGSPKAGALLLRRAIVKEVTTDLIAPDEYFDDALFIGDSRTEGLLIYSGLGNATFYFSKGLSVDQVFNKETVTLNGRKYTVSDALGREHFGKIYIMMGVNELGWVYLDKFIEKYVDIIDRIKETQPGATIYVQSILPVTKAKSDKDSIYNNPNIDKFNKLIEAMAADEEVVYLPVNEHVSDKSGVLPEEATIDGVHLNKEYCKKWEQYLRENTR
ncbi:hypothetical protein FACS1894127_0800 [Clostridia bacterium]|nr:hypothetical protein FACS1894127_0800 [Clostridia bacterium]